MSVTIKSPSDHRRRRSRTVGGNARPEAIAKAEIVRERSELAAQKMCALGEMTGGIAHDFRNILAIVASGLRAAVRNLDDSAGLKSALASIHEGIARGERMTARLLSFAGQQELIRSEEHTSELQSHA